ncbi:VRR-NUC domain containing protein [uncultured Caudovirales phage]|uniref:VRR-NUC domain containing protein n=1 Tax=uncultured Caudovirales phage TaxID=2100421 RepID=A0A6J5P5N4_9CAUD|nr:VRR-NUC domain containing protein [uncultured Caudovirales phage]CAB4194942.1 VRR-NUC domain containing protein [uncultured Caudovirales phage]CAB4223193.1 VRR-NUC domain containing protein [uncultured Caudovirales phage]CAB5226692.1 VRR-NUC domain containing protein [uncultured Caudovirales phage]
MADPSEAEFQKAVITLAKLHRWKVMHTQPAQVRPGRWITPNTGDQGFPDLVMVHPIRGTIFVELKVGKNEVSNTQWDWINTLEDAGQEVHVWRPKDLDKISDRLAKEPDAN